MRFPPPLPFAVGSVSCRSLSFLSFSLSFLPHLFVRSATRLSVVCSSRAGAISLQRPLATEGGRGSTKPLASKPAHFTRTPRPSPFMHSHNHGTHYLSSSISVSLLGWPPGVLCGEDGVWRSAEGEGRGSMIAGRLTIVLRLRQTRDMTSFRNALIVLVYGGGVSQFNLVLGGKSTAERFANDILDGGPRSLPCTAPLAVFVPFQANVRN